MKYIITKDGSPILFPDSEVHADIARRLGGATSAGFVHINKQTVEAKTYGVSMSTGLEPAIGDDALINRLIQD